MNKTYARSLTNNEHFSQGSWYEVDQILIVYGGYEVKIKGVPGAHQISDFEIYEIVNSQNYIALCCPEINFDRKTGLPLSRKPELRKLDDGVKYVFHGNRWVPIKGDRDE